MDAVECGPFQGPGEIRRWPGAGGDHQRIGTPQGVIEGGAIAQLEAMLLVADVEKTFLLTGTGDVVEPDEAAIAIGSGGPYAYAAARALVAHSALDARQIAEQAMLIAADVCIYTNRNIVYEEL